MNSCLCEYQNPNQKQGIFVICNILRQSFVLLVCGRKENSSSCDIWIDRLEFTTAIEQSCVNSLENFATTLSRRTAFST